MTQLRTGISEGEERQRVFRRLLLVLLLGIALGAVLAWRAPVLAQSRWFQQGFGEPAQERNLLTVFLDGLLPTVLLLLSALLFGFFAGGQLPALALLVWRGMALGCAAGGTYAAYGIRGLPVVLFLQLPHAAVTSVLLLLAVRETLRLSVSFFRFAISACERDGLREQSRLYLIRFLVLGTFLLVSAAGDTALTYGLSRFLLPVG